MNRICVLRKELKLSQRELAKRCGVTYSIIAYLENEKRPFRQIHIDKLTAFFSVTSDFLLGRSDNGYVVFPNKKDEPILLTAQEYGRLRDHINIRIIKVNPINIMVKGSKEITTIYQGEYTVFREIDNKLSDTETTDLLYNELQTLVKKLTAEDLEKLINFIKDYIIK